MLILSAFAWLETVAMMTAVPGTYGASAAMGPQSGMVMSGASGQAQAWTLGAWSLMVIAMMLPLTVGPLRVTVARSLWRRRQRAILEYLGGFTAVWILAGAALLSARAASVDAGWLLPSGQRQAESAALLLAAVWQLTPTKRRALLACHRAHPLAPCGWRSVLDCLRYGAATGRDCLRSCGVMMGALVVGDMAIGAMAVVAGVTLTECYSVRPRFAASAGVLAVLAMATFLV
jgi:hypothetical protein